MVELRLIEASTILTKASGFLEGYDFTLNPYRGCSFGCRYCYAAKHQYDPALERTWGQWVTIKANAPALLEKMAKSGALRGKAIYMSSVTDPYLPQESKQLVTRKCLQVFAEFPPRRLVIQTRGPLIERDIDILTTLRNVVRVSFSIPTHDDRIRRILEPSCASISRRIQSIKAMRTHGITVYAAIAPALPCDANLLAAQLQDIVTGIIVSGFDDDGAGGKNTRHEALDVIRANGWAECLDPGYAHRLTDQFRQFLGPVVQQGRDAFRALAAQ